MVKYYTYLELFLCDLRRQVSLSEFESHFKRPHQTIKSHLGQFVRERILIEEKRNRFLSYKLNLENPLSREYLSLCEKERLLAFLADNTLFSRLYTELSVFFSDAKMLLFGSCVAGHDYGDIDLLVISLNENIKSVLARFEQTYSKKVHLIQAEEKDLTQALIKEVRSNHIILNEHDYFMGVLYER